MTDRSAAIIVTTEDKTRACHLDIIADIEGWGFADMEPAHMRLGSAHAVILEKIAV
ncbi:MAG: hypothetical protein GY868_05510 [Deltaproteobacteria bacterium]|nr:hypothetical protein [Deltaproteobacteria bacterium]